MADKVADECEGLSAKPCANSYPELEGFENIQSLHEHGHFVRALLESTSESLSHLVQSLKTNFYSGAVISTGGGAQSQLWIQIKANLLRTVFYIPECSETACLGAALIGAANLKTSLDWDKFMNSWVRYKKSFRPV